MKELEIEQYFANEFPDHTFTFTEILFDPNSFQQHRKFLIDGKSTDIIVSIEAFKDTTSFFGLDSRAELLAILREEVNTYLNAK